ncbi:MULTISPECIES: hypothetical protein [unclassified Methanosarcina]|uniref:hypothetical protein n=1 Tax=unclassified Methanosarcina TaxID=2644672 RepID=UPI00064F539F|nr:MULTISPECIES: hypothetical protein [unclassified Methanosarcina]
MIKNLFEKWNDCYVRLMYPILCRSTFNFFRTYTLEEWHFLTRLKNNRLVNSDNKGNVLLETVDIPPKGRRFTSKHMDSEKLILKNSLEKGNFYRENPNNS